MDADTAFPLDTAEFKSWNLFAEDVDNPLTWERVEGKDTLVYKVQRDDGGILHVISAKTGVGRGAVQSLHTMQQFNNIKDEG